jgi:glycosyltransferase involved in cell wall biosynthesis
MKDLYFSIIIPIYNRPNELSELLSSISNQQENDFEVIVVEDGSSISSESVCASFQNRLPNQYITQANGGPGIARNTGVKYAKGKWFIFLDSDTLLPDKYLEIVKSNIETFNFDCYGGPDKAHSEFNTIQKAISYSMSSTLTTGGIRGGKENLDVFYPRTYNLGVKKEIFDFLKGFSNMRYGEDLDFSMRLLEN